jgi:hypothetical protein
VNSSSELRRMELNTEENDLIFFNCIVALYCYVCKLFQELSFLSVDFLISHVTRFPRFALPLCLHVSRSRLTGRTGLQLAVQFQKGMFVLEASVETSCSNCDSWLSQWLFTTVRGLNRSRNWIHKPLSATYIHNSLRSIN